jgi:hypothetical protein
LSVSSNTVSISSSVAVRDGEKSAGVFGSISELNVCSSRSRFNYR